MEESLDYKMNISINICIFSMFVTYRGIGHHARFPQGNIHRKGIKLEEIICD